MSAVPKRRCGLRVEPYQSTHCAVHTLRCAAHTLRCNGCRCVQLPVERCSGAVHCCRLRCDASSSALSGGAHSRGAPRCGLMRGSEWLRSVPSRQWPDRDTCGGRGSAGRVPRWHRRGWMHRVERSPAQTQAWAGTGQEAAGRREFSGNRLSGNGPSGICLSGNGPSGISRRRPTGVRYGERRV